MASSEDRIMMYYINLIAESERREKEQQQQQERSKDGRGVDRPPQDRRRAHTDEASAMTERALGPRKSRNDHGKKEKLKKRASSPTAVKSKKAKRKRPRQPEASPAPSSSSGINGGADLVDDEELLIGRRSTRNKFAIDDSPSLEEELHPKIVTISSGKLRDDRRPSSRAKQRKSKSNASRRRVRKPPADSSTDGDPGERKRRRLRFPSASSTDAEDDEGSHASGGRRRKSADDSLDGVLPDWALEGAVRRSSRIREAREGSVVSDKSAGDEGSARRKRGRPRKSSSAEALKTASRKTTAAQRSATRGSSRSTSASKKSTERRRVSEVDHRSSWPPKTGSLEIKVSTVAPLNGDIGFLRMEMCPKAGWSRSGIWRRSIGLERVPRFPPLPLEAHSRDSFI